MTSTKKAVSSGAKVIEDSVTLASEIISYAQQELRAIKGLSNLENVIEFNAEKNSALAEVYNRLAELEKIEDPNPAIKYETDSLKQTIEIIKSCVL
jgi:hypothetical protein